MSIVNSVSIVKNSKLLVVAVAMGLILNPLNTTMITVALPSIQEQFQATSKDISWLIASYFIVSAIFLPVIGKLSDHYGRKKIYLIGIVLVAISSFLAPFSPNMMVLLLMRGIQAIGTSALFPAGMGIVRDWIEENQNKVIAILAVCSSTSAAFGPTISGLLMQFGGWPVIFYINFPILIMSALLTFFYIPNDHKKSAVKFNWDVGGIVLFGLMIISWMAFFQSLEGDLNIWTFILSVVTTFLFYYVEKKNSEPFINVRFLIKNTNISLVYIEYVLATIVFFVLMLSMPTYLQSTLMLSSRITGVMMLSISIFAVIITPIATRWIDKSGYRAPLIFAGIVGIVGVALLFAVNSTTPLFVLFIILSIIGISNGFLNLGLQMILYTFVSKSESGIASGLFMTSRFIGNILASSLFGMLFATGINDANLQSMTIILLIVSIVLVPGLLFMTKNRAS